MPTISIGGRAVGSGAPVYIIAELSANHAGDLGRAIAIVQAAADAGADAVKLQTYTADTMTFPGTSGPFVVSRGTLWEGRTLYDLYREASTPWEWHEPLRDAAAAAGIGFFSTAFDARAVDLLEHLDVPVHKVASFELTDLELVERVAATGKPLILSTGMATLSEIDEAVRVARNAGCVELALLRCNSSYPAPPEEMDLAAIPAMMNLWRAPVGLSDHTTSPAAAIAATALGATLLEKHLTLSRDDDSADAPFSVEPQELAETIRLVRDAQAAVGSVRFGPTEHEKSSLAFRRSIFAVADIEAGEPFTRENVRVIRPASGVSPAALPLVLGRRAAVKVPAGTPLAWEMVGG